jgi:hypothetical protein
LNLLGIFRRVSFSDCVNVTLNGTGSLVSPINYELPGKKEARRQKGLLRNLE